MKPTPDTPTQGEPAGYDLEVLCASWNLLAATIAGPVEAGHAIVTEVATDDVERFLASFYRSQQG